MDLPAAPSKGYYVKVVLYSANPLDQRIACLEWRFPRVVLAETVTHRKLLHELGVEELCIHDTTTTDELSKNSASSRAIPLKTMLQDVREYPYVPDKWSKNNAGMSETEYLSGDDADENNADWLAAMHYNIAVGQRMADRGTHKQDVNRLLEPWAWTTQVVTATCWDNFFALRCDRRAAPAFRTLARLAYLALRDSVPQSLNWEDWHLPYIRKHEAQGIPVSTLLKISTARVAWTSYASPDKSTDIGKALDTYGKLVGGYPLHASPMEAQAQARPPRYFADNPEHISNLKHWLQHRKLLARENVTAYTPEPGEVDLWREEAQRLAYPVLPYHPDHAL